MTLFDEILTTLWGKYPKNCNQIIDKNPDLDLKKDDYTHTHSLSLSRSLALSHTHTHTQHASRTQHTQRKDISIHCDATDERAFKIARRLRRSGWSDGESSSHLRFATFCAVSCVCHGVWERERCVHVLNIKKKNS
jgi:hypothetical protein